MRNISWIILTLCVNSTVSFFSYSRGRQFTRKRNNCKTEEYQCGSGECINEDMICDGLENCRDGSDESSCLYFPCPPYAFRCTYGACINSNLVCDGNKNCKDNSDELYQCNEESTSFGISTNKCNVRQFACASGECIDDFDLCDGKSHCLDASDETVQTCSLVKCPQYASKCEYGACINSNLVCNGKYDCYDGSDEKYCDEITVTTSNPFITSPQESTSLSQYEYQCGSGEMISKDMLCDGRKDCGDGSDESSCNNFRCPEYSFRCRYGACINSNHVCDGKTDCNDNSDEIFCTGPNSSSSNNCSHTEYACNSGECIDDFDLCDGRTDCLDGSDEIANICINIVCPKYAFKCDYGACINADLRCNGNSDCLDGSDEKYCVRTSTPEAMKPTLENEILSPSLNDLGICKLPRKLENGEWKIYNEIDNLIPGQNYVKKYTILIFQCNENYILEPDMTIAICSNGWKEIPKCIKSRSRNRI